MPCRNLPITNGRVRISDLDKVLNIWECIERPAKPNRNDVSKSFSKRLVLERLAIRDMPLVISKRPLMQEDTTPCSKPNQ